MKKMIGALLMILLQWREHKYSLITSLNMWHNEVAENQIRKIIFSHSFTKSYNLN